MNISPLEAVGIAVGCVSLSFLIIHWLGRFADWWRLKRERERSRARERKQ
jgi:hypothetical protein